MVNNLILKFYKYLYLVQKYGNGYCFCIYFNKITKLRSQFYAQLWLFLFLQGKGILKFVYNALYPPISDLKIKQFGKNELSYKILLS